MTDMTEDPTLYPVGEADMVYPRSNTDEIVGRDWGEADMIDLTCPECDLGQSEWSDGGRGFEKYGELYCCKGCADGIGCTCCSSG
ncbi:MAG: hypothetical protein KY468_02105 [Armatimonadetes bacterium]|nr:hypothetical protein [Armatimonadota bacterium]